MDGTNVSLIDENINIESDSLNNKIINFVIEGINYFRTISDSGGNSIQFNAIDNDIPAEVVIGSARTEGIGQVTISVLGEETGEGYSVELIAGAGISSAGRVDFNSETGVLSIVSPTNEFEEPSDIMPGNIQDYITANETANTLFKVSDTVGGWPIPLTTEPVLFVDGDAVIGEGLLPEGQVKVVCKGSINGAIGNSYSIEIVHGTDITNDNIASLDLDEKILTITVNLTAEGNQRMIGASELVTLITNTDTISDYFMTDVAVVEGNLPIGNPATSFIGGSDAIIIPANTKYIVY